MSETMPELQGQAEDTYTERETRAIEHALDGYASNGETWIAARDAFGEAVDSGATREAALRRALEIAAEDAESSFDEAYVRFWRELEGEDGPHELYDGAIGSALDGYAKDSESWIEARDTFYEGMLNGEATDIALVTALDVATEGAESTFQEAYGRFWDHVHPSEELNYSPYGDVSVVTYVPVSEADHSWPEITREIGGGTRNIEKNEAERVFEEVEIRGDGVGGTLTPELLEQEGLLPRHEIKVGDRTIWFSRGYDLGGGRTAVVGYVQDGDSVVARSYYRSNSQGVWRYLPNYTFHDGRVNWYSKGYGEESITLPALLQESLTRSLEDDGEVLQLDSQAHVDAVFTGTARVVGSEGTGYHYNVSAYPDRVEGVQDSNRLPKPETVMPVYEEYPDFSNQLASWEQETGMYGRVSYEVFASRDGRLQFTFCRDRLGRAWIGGVENDSPLESTGLRSSWVKGGALTTPAYEYPQQADQYGNTDNARNGYVDMFKNYLSKMPPIQDYLASRAEA